ncbi:MAG: DUF2345 domain-containing protein [Janthinobacterium lividum]
MGHAPPAAGRSPLASARDAIRLFAARAGMRLSAASGDIDVTALRNAIHLPAKLEITHTAERIAITAEKEVPINSGGRYSRWNAAGVTRGTKRVWTKHAAGHARVGPEGLEVMVPPLAKANLESNSGFSPIRLDQQQSITSITESSEALTVTLIFLLPSQSFGRQQVDVFEDDEIGTCFCNPDAFLKKILVENSVNHTDLSVASINQWTRIADRTATENCASYLPEKTLIYRAGGFFRQSLLSSDLKRTMQNQNPSH